MLERGFYFPRLDVSQGNGLCSQCVVTMECVEKIIRKEMTDPINGKPLEEDDIIELQRGGTGNEYANFCFVTRSRRK